MKKAIFKTNKYNRFCIDIMKVDGIEGPHFYYTHSGEDEVLCLETKTTFRDAAREIARTQSAEFIGFVCE